MRLPFFIARKYFLSKENTGAINIMSWVSMIGMAVGTMALIIFLSVFNGFESLINQLYGAFYPDIVVEPARGKTFTVSEGKLDSLRNRPEVAHISKIVEENALLKYKEQQYIGTIKGVDSAYIHVNAIEDHLVAGQYKLHAEDGQSRAILGSGVKARLGVNISNLYHPINVYVPKRERTYSLIPRQAFYHKPIYASGAFSIQQDFDLKYVIVPIEFARDLLRYKQELSAIEIKLHSATDLSDGEQVVEEYFPDNFDVLNRFEQNRFLYQVMQSERWAGYSIVTFVLLLLAFNMVGCLTMLVIEKSDDITILKSMGASNALIRRIFMIEGLMLGGIGGGIGAILAVTICLIQQYGEVIKISGSGSFVIEAYPVEMHVMDFVLVTSTVIAIALLASWYPAYKAARQEEGIQQLE